MQDSYLLRIIAMELILMNEKSLSDKRKKVLLYIARRKIMQCKVELFIVEENDQL